MFVCLFTGAEELYPSPGILQDTVNKRAVRILLECFLVDFFLLKGSVKPCSDSVSISFDALVQDPFDSVNTNAS